MINRFFSKLKCRSAVSRFCIFSLLLNCYCLSTEKSHIRIIPNNQLRDTVHTLIESAKKEILIAQFILIKDKSGLEVIEHLKKKARSGVKVKIVVDGIGAYSDVPIRKKDMLDMAQHGIQIKVYHPKLKHFWKIKKRMHDKILWVDGKVILGSSSFWDISFDRYQIEMDVLVEGAIAFPIKEHFFRIWNSKEVKSVSAKERLKKNKRNLSFLWNVVSLDKGISVVDMEYIHDPVKKKRGVGSIIRIIDFFKRAKKSIVIINPYFLPPSLLKKTFLSLKKKGIKVVIYTNSPETLELEYKMLGLAYSSMSKFIKKCGLTVYENKINTKMIHSKYFIVDDHVIYLGSQNLDYLGVNHNTENGIIFFNKSFLAKLQLNIEFIKRSSFLAFDNGIRIRKKYIVRNPFKKIWRHILVFFFRDLL